MTSPTEASVTAALMALAEHDPHAAARAMRAVIDTTTGSSGTDDLAARRAVRDCPTCEQGYPCTRHPTDERNR